jgi:hypothetical protein
MDTDTQRYWIDEGALTLPAGFEDRSANIFVQAEVEHSSLNLNIGRDRLRTGEAPDNYVTRQIGVMKERISGYKLLGRGAAELGTGPSAIAGEQVDASHKSGNRTIHQRQAAFALDDTRVLIFSASSGSPFGEHSNALWQAWLASFSPRGATENTPASAPENSPQD